MVEQEKINKEELYGYTFCKIKLVCVAFVSSPESPSLFLHKVFEY